MSLKNKFHLTLVVLIAIANNIIGYPIGTAQALDIKNQSAYNRNISNIYNNINIKYISIKYYNQYNNYNNSKRIAKLSNALSFKEKVEIVMYSVKQVESNGRYKAKSKWSTACGAYQYLHTTWNNYGGFKTACLAPETVQDTRMRGEVRYLWKKYNDWDKVIASHYMPAYAGNKALWDKSAGGLSVREYVQNVNRTMNRVVLGLATA